MHEVFVAGLPLDLNVGQSVGVSEQVVNPNRSGLRPSSIGRLGSTVIGMASTAPAYSLAATVGLIVIAVGNAAPLALALSVVPMVLIALSYRELNRAEPNCGATFSWTRRAFGPSVGFMAGWLSIAACILVMSNLAQVSAIYAYGLFGFDGAAESVVAQGILGVGVMLLLAWLADRGLQLTGRMQVTLLAFEIAALIYFSVKALAAGALFNPFAVGGDTAWGVALLAGVFIYWGWDSSFSLNEESEEPNRTPAIAALVANGLLALVFVFVAFSAIAYAGAENLGNISEDDFFAALGTELLGTTGGKVMTIAVLLSALASTQTTILPAARAVLAMAATQNLPKPLARISERGTPATSTWAFAIVSIALYIALLVASEDVLSDSVAATAVLIALYYGATSAAVPVYFRHDLSGTRNTLMRVVLPTLAALACLSLLILASRDLSTVTVVTVAVVIGLGLIGSTLVRSTPVEALPTSETHPNETLRND